LRREGEDRAERGEGKGRKRREKQGRKGKGEMRVGGWTLLHPLQKLLWVLGTSEL